MWPQDAVGGLLAHARQGGEAPVLGRLLHALRGADAQLGADEHGRLGPDAGNRQQVQGTLGQFGPGSLVGLHLPGGHQLLYLVADGFADAGYAGDFLPVVDRLGQGKGQLGDGAGCPLVGANLEHRVALHFQQGTQVLEQLRDFFVGRLHPGRTACAASNGVTILSTIKRRPALVEPAANGCPKELCRIIPLKGLWIVVKFVGPEPVRWFTHERTWRLI